MTTDTTKYLAMVTTIAMFSSLIFVVWLPIGAEGLGHTWGIVALIRQEIVERASQHHEHSIKQTRRRHTFPVATYDTLYTLEAEAHDVAEDGPVVEARRQPSSQPNPFPAVGSNPRNSFAYCHLESL